MSVRRNKTFLARNFAVSLCQQNWTREALETCLDMRLPVAQRGRAAGIADWVISEFNCAVAPPEVRVAEGLVASPEFGKVFRYCLRHNVWPEAVIAPAVMRPAPVFADLDLPILPDLAAVAEWAFVSIQRLTYLADLDGRYVSDAQAAANHYHYDFLQKSSGGVRVIEAPKAQLNAVQRRVLDQILNNVPLHDAAFGFVAGRSCLDGAAQHVREEMVVGFDLADFFPSVGMGRVFGVFRMLGYPEAVARVLTGLCTNRTPARVVGSLGAEVRALYRTPHLPQGAPSSPALVNLVAFGLDCRLHGLARRLGARYTRYADDLTFSGDRGVERILLEAVPKIVRECGFAVRREKTRVMPSTGRQVVTGIVVNERLNVARAEFDRIKAVIHACGKDGDQRLRDPLFRARLQGHIGWIAAVNEGRGAKLAAALKRVDR